LGKPAALQEATNFPILYRAAGQSPGQFFAIAISMRRATGHEYGDQAGRQGEIPHQPPGRRGFSAAATELASATAVAQASYNPNLSAFGLTGISAINRRKKIGCGCLTDFLGALELAPLKQCRSNMEFKRLQKSDQRSASREPNQGQKLPPSESMMRCHFNGRVGGGP
jgi:hypothetical protein